MVRMDKNKELLSIIRVLPTIRDYQIKKETYKFSKEDKMILKAVYNEAKMYKLFTFRDFKRVLLKYAVMLGCSPFSIANNLKNELQKQYGN